MRPLSASIKVVVAALLISPTGLFGQIPGNIDWPVLPGGTGVRGVVDGTQGLNSDSGEALYLGARVLHSRPEWAFWFGGGYAGMAASGDNVATGGVGFSYALSNFGQTTLSVDAGFGLTKRSGTWIWGAPAGLTLWINTTPQSLARPFIRAHAILADAGFETDVGFSALGGCEFGSASGLGFQVALQWETLDGSNTLVVGGGLSFGF